MTGGERNAGDGCHKVSNSLQGLVCQSSNPTIKEEWRTTTCDQADGVEHIHTLQRFQDGRALSIKINFGTRRLPMQVGPQRRLFLCLMEQAVKEVYTSWMEGFPIRVYLSVFWRRSRPKVFYKLISSRTSSGYKYSRTEASKIYDIYIQQIQKGSSSPCANGKSSSISLFGNNGGTRNLLMIQEAKEIWELCFAFFKYKGRQGLQGNEKLVKRMDIKQANVDVNLFECKLSNHTQRYISW